MKALTRLFILSLLVALSSCVYSLHGIITPEAVVYLPALEGTWQYKDEYRITFYGAQDPNLALVEEIDSVTFKIADGTILHYPEDKFAMLAATLAEEFRAPNNGEEEERILTRQDSLDKGAFTYLVEMAKDGDSFYFQGHLVQIGEEYYLDLTDIEINFEETGPPYKVLMPVHSFLKIGFSQTGQLQLTDFDLSKMRDLFREGNVRLKHEEVDSEILITAQPKEIQAFLKTYGQSPDVFDTTKDFRKVTP